MSKYRRAAKVDLVQQDIVLSLRQIGYSVITGMDDILVGYHGKTYWYELKSEHTLSKKTGEVREKEKQPTQVKLEQEWRGHYKIVSSLKEITDDIMNNNS